MGKEFLTTKEAAERLHRCEKTLRNWAAKGKGLIKPIRTVARGGRLLWRAADIEEVLRNGH